jgi:hypothetical protein
VFFICTRGGKFHILEIFICSTIFTNIHTEKTSNAIADNIAIQTGTAERKILQLNDNHPKAIAQRKIQQAAMSSQQVKQSMAYPQKRLFRDILHYMIKRQITKLSFLIYEVGDLW